MLWDSHSCAFETVDTFKTFNMFITVYTLSGKRIWVLLEGSPSLS